MMLDNVCEVITNSSSVIFIVMDDDNDLIKNHLDYLEREHGIDVKHYPEDEEELIIEAGRILYSIFPHIPIQRPRFSPKDSNESFKDYIDRTTKESNEYLELVKEKMKFCRPFHFFIPPCEDNEWTEEEWEAYDAFSLGNIRLS